MKCSNDNRRSDERRSNNYTYRQTHIQTQRQTYTDTDTDTQANTHKHSQRQTEVVGRWRAKPNKIKARSFDKPARSARTIVHHYNGTQYCNAETVFNIALPPDQYHISHVANWR